MHDRLKSALLEDAIEVALTQGRDGLGTIVTFASGNYNTIDYPGSSDERIICVGSIGENHERASTSGYGERLDLVAPGVNILSTVLNNTVGNKSGTYRVGQGHYCPLPPSEPYVRVSPHTAQAFQSLCSCAETGSSYFLFPLFLRDNLKHSL